MVAILKYAATVTQTMLLSALKSLQEVPEQDLQRCLRMGLSINLASQDRVKWMMQARQLQDWLHAARSCTLLLNGNSDANDAFAPTTFLAAKLLEGLSHIEPVISLHFFGSLHLSFREELKEDASTLIESLISQLLLRDNSYNLTFISKPDLAKINHNDLLTLCTLFRHLIQQLPNPTFLFCIIDGINFYERFERRHGFLTVIKELLGVTEDSKDVIIKLLLTSHGKSTYVRDLIGKDDILTVPAFIDGGRQGWSDIAFQKTLGREIEDLGKGVRRTIPLWISGAMQKPDD